MKYLLTTGKVTGSFEEYIIDLFKLYLNVYPGDIPGAKKIGFNFILTDTLKADLPREINNRVSNLINTFQNRFESGVNISLISCELIDETLAKIVVAVNEVSDEIVIKLYENN